MHRNSKAQSAIEFVSTYAFVFLIIAIIIVLLFALSSIPTKTLPFQCTAFGGFSCVDVLFTSAGNSLLQVSLTDTQAGVVSISSFNAKINSVSAIGTCTPTAVLAGNTVTCTAAFPFKAGVGNIYTGVFNVSANYCTNGVGNISNTTCKAGNSLTYAGSLTTQAQAPALPQYVASFNGQSNNYLIISNTPSLTSISASAWVYVAGGTYSEDWAIVAWPSPGNSVVDPIIVNPAGSYWHFYTYVKDWLGVAHYNVVGTNLNYNQWYFLTMSYSSDGKLNQYINGAKVFSQATGGVGLSSFGPWEMSGHYDGSYYGYYNGLVSDFQAYNIVLTPGQIQNLYAEGMGGTPINTANNFGWWPLNNNVNDASGMGNNGVATGMTYNSNWFSGYTAP